jgi:peptidoglycan/xylan/chitin deacetylase (PgdA/CDA1 family)
VDRSLRFARRALFAATILLSASLHTSDASAAATRQIFAPVLIYHHVKPLLPSDDAIERGLTVLPSHFEAQLRYLRTSEYHVITAGQLVRHLRTGSSLPANPVVLSFDDGYADMFSQVYGRLLRAHMKGTFFIVPSFLGTPRYLSWRQVEIMAAHGMDIEAHTMTHPDLTRISPRSVRWQLTEARRELRARLHRVVNVLAYPYGAYSPQVVAAVARAGYQAAFTTQQGWVESSAHPLIEPRVYVDIDDTLTIFVGRVRGDPRILAADPT